MGNKQEKYIKIIKELRTHLQEHAGKQDSDRKRLKTILIAAAIVIALLFISLFAFVLCLYCSLHPRGEFGL